MQPQAAVDRFLNAFYTGDIPRILESVVPEFTMHGPFATAHNAQELIELSKPLFDRVQGVRFHKWVVDGENVSALYEIAVKGRTKTGWMTMGGWFTVAGDRVTAGQVIYDNPTFAELVSA
jgi:hypothetical protein